MQIRSAAHRVIRRLGYDVVRLRASDCPERRRQLLLDANNISIVVDVGANVGQYGSQIRDAGYTKRILSFEPVPEAFAELHRRTRSDPEWECRHMACGNADGETLIHVSRNSVSSSILPALEQLTLAAPRAAFTNSVKVPIKRLDTVVCDLVEPDDRLWLKLDVQGYERLVLDGARGTLRQTWVIESELTLAALYDGQELYQGMIDYLRTLGFTLVSLERGFTDPNTGHVLQVDGIFVRCTGDPSNDIRWTS